MTCARCSGLLRPDDDGIQVCRACSYPASVPPVYPAPWWPGGVQPASRPYKPHSGGNGGTPPPGEAWGRTHTVKLSEAQIRQREEKRSQMWKKATLGPKATGKTWIAPVGDLGL